ncbi:MAG TPA: 16S rRNA (guanine(527)-N(7))-methyltransferase RsmG [Mycobacteriales bacterium]|nr:16S rRNA (guanine(527)-N(7))-methyltransferase RsmG [Mycobacteriales bacterium]
MFGTGIGRVRRYADWLAEIGVAWGLIGPGELDRLWERHLLNCAAVAPLLPARGELVDVGSGAGLPGMVLAVLRPDLQVTLLEPNLRRCRFLVACRDDLGLHRVEVVRARAEDVHGRLFGDAVISRAVAPLAQLLPKVVPLTRPGGVLLAIKGERARSELAAAGGILKQLGLTEATVETCGDAMEGAATLVVRIRMPRSGPAGGGDDRDR